MIQQRIILFTCSLAASSCIAEVDEGMCVEGSSTLQLFTVTCLLQSELSIQRKIQPPDPRKITEPSSLHVNEHWGGDTDIHGCKASAGYTWCPSKQKCLHTWKENCPKQSALYAQNAVEKFLACLQFTTFKEATAQGIIDDLYKTAASLRTASHSTPELAKHGVLAGRAKNSRYYEKLDSDGMWKPVKYIAPQ